MNFAPAVRQNVPLIIGIAGPSGGGKTYSALRLAKGLAGGGKIAAIDTERGRMLHYADEFEFMHAELDAPFSPDHYGEALTQALAIDPAVVLVDSFSHEWAGDGGVLDMQEAELERMAGGDWKKREAVRFASWIKPKSSHKALVNDVLLRLPCHLIVCLRAEDRVEMKKDPKTGKLEVVPKRTLSGYEGWIPVTGKEIGYELTMSLVVTPDNPGVPVPIKLQEQHRSLVFTDVPLDEATGERLAAWAKGSVATPSAADKPGASPLSPEPAAIHHAEGSSPSDAPEPSYEDNIAALNALVTSLSQENIVSKRQVWVAVARMRSKPVDELIDLYDGKGQDGEVHWSPLRKIIRPEEAAELRKRLGAKWAETREGAAA